MREPTRRFMNNVVKPILVSFVAGLILTVLTFLFIPIHLVQPATSIYEHGFPFVYYWTGYADLAGTLNQFFVLSFLSDLAFWSVVSFFAYLILRFSLEKRTRSETHKPQGDNIKLKVS